MDPAIICQACGGVIIPFAVDAIRISYGRIYYTAHHPTSHAQVRRGEEDDWYHRGCAGNVAIRQPEVAPKRPGVP